MVQLPFYIESALFLPFLLDINRLSIRHGIMNGHGQGNYLWMFCEGNSYFNQLVWQPVTVHEGDTLRADGAFKDLTDGNLNSFWCELYLGLSEPADNVDYLDNMRRGFSWWDNCASGIDGTFLADACVTRDTTGYWVVPDTMGTGDVIIYFGVKAGIWTDGSEGTLEYEIAIDSLSLITLGGSASGIKESPAAQPNDFVLYANFPNPFNPSTSIWFSMAKTADIDLSVYDIHGRLVKSLIQQTMNPGKHKVVWNGLDEQGTVQPSGLYLCRLKSGLFSATRRMVLIK